MDWWFWVTKVHPWFVSISFSSQNFHAEICETFCGSVKCEHQISKHFPCWKNFIYTVDMYVSLSYFTGKPCSDHLLFASKKSSLPTRAPENWALFTRVVSGGECWAWHRASAARRKTEENFKPAPVIWQPFWAWYSSCRLSSEENI